MHPSRDPALSRDAMVVAIFTVFVEAVELDMFQRMGLQQQLKTTENSFFFRGSDWQDWRSLQRWSDENEESSGIIYP
jgi:hypothetical protein